MPYLFSSVFPLGDPPGYDPLPEASVAGIAEATGKSPWEVLYDHLAAGGWLLGAFTNYALGCEDHLVDMIEHPNTVIGLSDGGAHVKMICDASVPTYLLSHWARDRRRGGLLPLETVVQKQTSGTASIVGLTDRGTLEVGKKADLNVIDFDHLTLHAPRSVDDLPAGGRRVLQDATGLRRDDRERRGHPARRPRHRGSPGAPRPRSLSVTHCERRRPRRRRRGSGSTRTRTDHRRRPRPTPGWTGRRWSSR